MSIVFSSTTSKNGILQVIERRLGFDDGFITGNTTRLAQWTSEVNLAMDMAFAIIFQASGTWQFDDSNHTNYPIITTNLVSAQRDYSFTSDQNSNLILDIYKVFVADSSGVFSEIFPVDVQSGADGGGESGNTSGRIIGASGLSSFTDGRNTTGTPYRYDKTANGIFLDPIPNYNSTNGLKVYINREGSYFSTSDTTKKAGFGGLFHEYLVYRPCANYALDKSLAVYKGFEAKALRFEQDMGAYYGLREKDVRRRLTPNVENTR